ncbi:peptide MFS transporter [Planctomycetes bacterium K23_9]|uniref:Putative dipeptide and tripeptide permease YjdL n=1 Tax=Stieleria marina TaxID=1930275 RepID=A0A517P3H4_9BACT|nr:putative dipeptide and tripeptide permease YjdL [Planctomycetes bacterium K23_9]
MSQAQIEQQPKVFGHPSGLYTLFFAEMWERFSYYGMRALLIFYMIKGFLGYGDAQAYTVYGAYTALVYMTPFIGGLLADKILGKRIAVVIGGLLMAAGHLLMTIESEWPFFFALALLIVGNGFFKPNISTTVGSLYRQGDRRRDDGFNIFYTGINLGAAMSPLLCGFVGETYGWHYGFGLATIGMLIGLAVFVMPNLVTQLLIMAGAIASSVGMLLFRPDNIYAILINIFVAVCLMAAAVVAWIALSRGGLPTWAGGRPEGVSSKHDWKIYTGIAISIPIFALLVSGFSPFTQPAADAVLKTKDVLLQERVAFLEKLNVDADTVAQVQAAGISVEPKLRGETYKLINQETIDSVKGDGSSFAGTIAGIFLEEVSKPAGLVLTVLGILAFGYLIIETFKLNKVQRERMIAALVLIFFQMLFFAFFEQAGSSVNNFTDRNIDRVGETTAVTDEMVGTTIRIEPTQAQLGYQFDSGKAFTNSDLDQLRKIIKETPNLDKIEVDWNVADSNVGMGIASRLDELPASIFQSFNAIFILIFALVFNWLWSALRRKNMDPSAPIKFGLGLIQLGLGFGAFWLGAQNCTSVGMVAISWLTLGILLQTTGELCLSPVGLSTMTKLSPKILVSTLMGAWFLATAFSQYLAAIISQFTSVGGHGGGGADLPAPKDTVHIYGDVFGSIAMTAIASGILCIILSPILKNWMHEGVVLDDDGNPVETQVSAS